jgi:hypothetical protein
MLLENLPVPEEPAGSWRTYRFLEDLPVPGKPTGPIFQSQAVQKSYSEQLILVPFLSQINPAHALLYYLFKIYFNIILPNTLKSSK